MAELKRCLVDVAVVTESGGVRFGPGATVDLDAYVGSVRLRDCVEAAWFVPVEESVSAPAPRRRRAVSSPEETDAT